MKYWKNIYSSNTVNVKTFFTKTVARDQGTYMQL